MTWLAIRILPGSALKEGPGDSPRPAGASSVAEPVSATLSAAGRQVVVAQTCTGDEVAAVFATVTGLRAGASSAAPRSGYPGVELAETGASLRPVGRRSP